MFSLETGVHAAFVNMNCMQLCYELFKEFFFHGHKLDVQGEQYGLEVLKSCVAMDVVLRFSGVNTYVFRVFVDFQYSILNCFRR